jgi:hypothetical protein
MPYEVVRYHCNVCRQPYKKYAEAERCERQNHHARTVWPSHRPTPAEEP